MIFALLVGVIELFSQTSKMSGGKAQTCQQSRLLAMLGQMESLAMESLNSKVLPLAWLHLSTEVINA